MYGIKWGKKRVKLDCIFGENSFEIHPGENDYTKHTNPKVISHRCFST